MFDWSDRRYEVRLLNNLEVAWQGSEITLLVFAAGHEVDLIRGKTEGGLQTDRRSARSRFAMTVLQSLLPREQGPLPGLNSDRSVDILDNEP